jgi:methyl-accepting chemotaxis protein
LEAVANRISETATLVSQMSQGTSDQSSSLSEINVAVGHLDRVTQQNAGMVEEVTSSSNSLRQQTAVLKDLVSKFKVNSSVEAFKHPRAAEQPLSRAG